MSLVINCDDTASYDSRTLAQLRAMMVDGLGFLSPLSGFTPRTLLDMRTDLRAALGLPDPLTNILTRTLTQLQTDMYPVLGWGAMGSPPPGANGELAEFINLAQQTLWRSLELDQGSNSVPPLMSAGSDATTLDYLPVLNMALGLAKQFYGQGDGQSYFAAAQKYLSDYAQRSPPNVNKQINSALNSAQQTVYRRYEVGKSGAVSLAPFLADSDTTTVDPQAIFLLALANLKTKIGQGDSKLLFEEYQQYMADLEKRSPPDLTTVCNRFLKDAQERLYRTYEVFRMERWYTWTLSPSSRFYGIAANDEQTGSPASTKTIDPRLVHWVGTSNGDNNWRPLRKGIPPQLYNGTTTGPPTHYEIRQTIEIWPTPITGWQLRIKGTFGLLPFEADTDVTSMDWQAVYLTALADASAHYKKADAPTINARAREYIGNLNAGEHAGARYIPGRTNEWFPAVRPVIVP